MRVLVVEDHTELAETIAVGLRRAGMAVDTVYDGHDALLQADLYDYDVIVLDRDLPGIHGDRVCERLTAGDGRARILMLTALGEITDRVDGLGFGADDYLPKPFAFAELVARVRALARRAQRAVPPLLQRDDLQLDTVRRIARRGGAEVALTAKELAVLEVLMTADGAAISSEELLGRAWDEEADPFTNVVKVTISRLRRKLGEPQLIETVPGAGYRI